jgi:SAM-dependent methyltransferase
MKKIGISGTIAAVVSLLASPALPARQHGQNQQQGTPDHMHHRFDDPAKFAASFDDPARDGWQMPDRVIGALNLERSSRVADIGAGTGYFSMRLADAVPDGWVYAVDVEPAMVEYIRDRAGTDHVPNLQAVLATADSPNLPEPVDVSLVVNTYHHIPSRPDYFRRLQSSLRPGGRVAIVDYRKDAPDGPPAEFRFEPEQIVAEMQKAGYELEARHDFLPRQHFLVFRPAGQR